MFRGALIGILALAGALLACGQARELRHPLYPALVQEVRTLLILPPDISVFQQMQDGSILWREEFSRAASAEVLQALEESLTAKRLATLAADENLLRDPDVQGLQSLFRAVDRSIQRHTQGSQSFPSKVRDFDYEVGPVAEVLKKSGADALVLAVGQQTVSREQPGLFISIAVVEPQGRIIWYNRTAEPSDPGNQRPRTARELIKGLLHSFFQGVS